MDLVQQVLRKDRFCRDTVGIELVEVTPGRAKTRLKIGEHHLNGVGIVQGGAIFTLADYALAAASNSHGTVAVLVNANMSYFKATSGGTLVAEAVEESFNNKLATYTVRVLEQGGELVAMMQATVYRKKETLASVLK